MRKLSRALLPLVMASLAACSAPTVGGLAVAGSPVTLAACASEDGSTPGQAFPCRWDAANSGNGIGRSFTLDAPICSEFEVALSDAAHRLGRDVRLACDDAESSLTYVN